MQQVHEATQGLGARPQVAPLGVSVLFATDESDAARNGEEWIRRLRWARTPAVDVLTIAPRPGWVFGLGLQTYRPAVRDAVILARETELVEAQRVANGVGSRLQHAGIPVRVWARSGEAADEILRASRMEGVDLVVLGSSGKAGRALPWGRSVSSHVARNADVAVLVAQLPPPGDARLPRSIAILDVDDAATAGALAWLTDTGWLDEAHVTRARPEGGDGRPTKDVFAAVLQEGTVDLAVVPGMHDRRAADAVLRVADAARVSVLLTPAPNRYR